MIELCGFVPEEDIQIRFVGLRPGEKLYEEPIHCGENITNTSHLKIHRLVQEHKPIFGLVDEIAGFYESPLLNCSSSNIKEWLANHIPEYSVWINGASHSKK